MIAANESVTDTGRMSQSNSLTAVCARHFISCEESGTITTLTDIKKNAVIFDIENPANTSLKKSLAEGDDPGVSVNFLAWGNDLVTEFDWDNPGTDDFLILVAAKAKNDPGIPVDGNPYYGGCISFYYSNEVSKPELKIHPYFTAYTPGGSGAGQYTTDPYQPMMRRNNNQNYVIAGTKDQTGISHFVDGVRQGRRELDSDLASQDAFNASVGIGGTDNLSQFQNWLNGDSSIYHGHAAYDTMAPVVENVGLVGVGGDYPSPTENWALPSDPEWSEDLASWGYGLYRWTGNPLFQWYPNSTYYSHIPQPDGTRKVLLGTWDPSNIAELAQDVFGFLVCVFADGLPSDDVIKEAMDFISEEWPSGNKVIPPCLVSLL